MKKSKYRKSRGSIKTAGWIDAAMGTFLVRAADKFLAPKIGQVPGQNVIVPALLGIFGDKIGIGNVSAAGQVLAMDRLIGGMNIPFAGNNDDLIPTAEDAASILEQVEAEQRGYRGIEEFAGTDSGFIIETNAMPIEN
jgi:hypothetical protein